MTEGGYQKGSRSPLDEVRREQLTAQAQREGFWTLQEAVLWFGYVCDGYNTGFHDGACDGRYLFY